MVGGRPAVTDSRPFVCAEPLAIASVAGVISTSELHAAKVAVLGDRNFTRIETKFRLYSVRCGGSAMKLTNRVKPISKLKAQAADVIDDVTRSKTPVVITVNGEAKAVLQDIASYEETQEALALLKILALANKDVVAGKVRPMKAAFAQVRRRARA